MIKGIERVVPILKFQLRGVQVIVDGVRQDVPPKMESIRYEIIVDTDEPDRRIDLLHDNVKKYGTVVNTVTALLFMRGREHDLNIRSVFLHMAADALVSAGVVVAGALTLWMGWIWLDPVVIL